MFEKIVPKAAETMWQIGIMELFFETARECWSTIHSGGWPELGWLSYVLLALLVATEGPVSTLLGAATAATGLLDIRYVFLSAFLGNVLGDCLWYSVGYVNDLKKIHRFGSWFGIRSHHVDRLEEEMHTHATKLIALSKLAIGLIVPTLIAAGLARVPWRRWFPLVLSIEVAWTLVMVNLGFYGAGLITQLERSIQLIGVLVVIGLVGGMIWYGRRIFVQNEVSMATQQPIIHIGTSVIAGAITVTNLEDVHTTKATLYKRLPAELTAYKRTAYKQLVGRLSKPRLPVKTLMRKSFAAKSMMTRAIASRMMDPIPSRPRPPRHVQINFAGD